MSDTDPICRVQVNDAGFGRSTRSWCPASTSRVAAPTPSRGGGARSSAGRRRGAGPGRGGQGAAARACAARPGAEARIEPTPVTAGAASCRCRRGRATKQRAWAAAAPSAAASAAGRSAGRSPTTATAPAAGQPAAASAPCGSAGVQPRRGLHAHRRAPRRAVVGRRRGSIGDDDARARPACRGAAARVSASRASDEAACPSRRAVAAGGQPDLGEASRLAGTTHGPVAPVHGRASGRLHAAAPAAGGPGRSSTARRRCLPVPRRRGVAAGSRACARRHSRRLVRAGIDRSSGTRSSALFRLRYRPRRPIPATGRCSSWPTTCRYLDPIACGRWSSTPAGCRASWPRTALFKAGRGRCMRGTGRSR